MRGGGRREHRVYLHETELNPPPPSSTNNSFNPPSTSPPNKERDYDLSIDLHPLSHYVAEPRRLLREALAILGPKRLSAMIPPSLKTMGRRNLEFFCMEELEKLDQGTLLNIIAGKERREETKFSKQPSSHHDVEGGDSPLRRSAVNKFKHKLKKALTQDSEERRKEKKMKKRSQRDKSGQEEGEEEEEEREASPAKKSKKTKLKAKKRKKRRKKEEPNPSVPIVTGEKTLMELLELEYRAKAIKALLRTQGHNASKIDDALSLDAPPPSPTLQTLVPPPSPPILRSPDSSNLVLRLSQSPQPTDEQESESFPVLEDKAPSPPQVVSSSIPDSESPSEQIVIQVEEEEEEMFEVQVERKEEDEEEVDPLSTQPPTPKEVEEGEIDSGEESGGGGGEVLDVFGSSSEEETSIWRKRPVFNSPSDSDSEDEGRRPWAKTKSPSNRRRSSCDKSLSDISLVDLAVDEEEKAVIQKEEEKTIDELLSSPDCLLEPLSEEEEEEEEGDEEKEVNVSDDFESLPLIQEDGSVLYPTQEKESEESDEEEEEETPLTWYHRWYQSKKIQRVVKANKMYGSLRKQLRKEKDKTQPPSLLPPEPEVNLPIIGSIEEYEHLFGKPKPKTPPPIQPLPTPPTPDDKESEEDEDAELWGDIILEEEPL